MLHDKDLKLNSSWLACTEEVRVGISSTALQLILTFGASNSSPPLLKKDDYATEIKDASRNWRGRTNFLWISSGGVKIAPPPPTGQQQHRASVDWPEIHWPPCLFSMEPTPWLRVEEKNLRLTVRLLPFLIVQDAIISKIAFAIGQKKIGELLRERILWRITLKAFSTKCHRKE